MSYPTGRKFSRSLSEAFADERACAITRYPSRRLLGRFQAVALAVFIGAVLMTLICRNI